MMTKINKAWGKVYPPFIDAYNTAPSDSLDNSSCGWSFDDFCNSLKEIARTWGEQSIGIQAMTNPNGKITPDVLLYNMPIWACGTWNNQKYVLVGKINWWYDSRNKDEYKIIQFSYPEYFNVT